MQAIVAQLAQEIRVSEAQVAAAVALLDGGATVPFIARYRKEATGGLDDVQLRELEARLAGADVLIISCRNLIRGDFSAAGTLLNWVSRHHAEGRIVQFVDVHRLVSAFFHVIGITEYSKVVLRTD